MNCESHFTRFDYNDTIVTCRVCGAARPNVHVPVGTRVWINELSRNCHGRMGTVIESRSTALRSARVRFNDNAPYDPAIGDEVKLYTFKLDSIEHVVRQLDQLIEEWS